MSQVYGFAKQSGGEIRVTSTLGRGSIFTLYLPRVDMPAMSAVAARPTGIVNGDGGCVLVVEDDPDVGSFAKHALAELGYRTSFARDARTALRMIADADGEFDMVFSDVVMPGMRGIELARAVRTRHPDLPIVLTSGYSDTLAAEGSSGFNLLHKPYSLETLSQALSAARR